MLIKKGILPVLLAVLMVFAALSLGAETAYAAHNGGNTNIKDATITISSLTYNGKIQKPKIKVVVGNVTLVEGTDYTLEYQNQSSINAGNYKVTISGKGNYNGKANKQYTIAPKKITPAVVLSKKAFVYNGNDQKPTVTAVKDGTIKIADSNYSVSFVKTSKSVGTYAVTVTLKGNYTGSAKPKYKINPKGTSLTSLTSGSKLFKVKWKKQAALMSESRITGYQLMLATNSKFTKNKKLVTVKGYSTVSKKVTKLLGGKKYFVKVRTYKTINGVKHFSKWSKAWTRVTKK